MLGTRLRTLRTLATLVPLTLAGTEVTSAAPVSSHAAAGSTLTIALPNDITGWGPDQAQGNYQAWPFEAVYDSLVRCTVSNAVVPGLATSWTFNPRHTVFTAHIRPGMVFSDGTPVNAAAVKANYSRDQKLPTGGGYWTGLTFTTPDPMTIVVTSAKPDPAMPVVNLCSNGIASPKYLASGKLNTAPVGSGPYTLEASATTPGSVYTLVKNPGNWDAKAFPFNTIVMKVIGSPTAIINALKTGQLDGAPVPQNLYNETIASGLKLVALPGETTRLLITDHLGKIVQALGNVNVRRAMNMVFDKSAIAKALYQGHATPTDQIPPPTADAYSKGLKDPYPYNIAAAKALMAKAGYANGFSVDMPFYAGVGMDSLFPVVIQQLGLINIKVHEVTLTGPNAISELLSGKYPLLMWPLGNYGNTLSDIAQAILQPSIWNVEHQPDATIQSLYTKMLNSTTTAQYKANLQAIYRYTIDQAWFVPIVYQNVYFAYNPKTVSIPAVSDSQYLNPLLWDFRLP